jgi:hypothetical protein
MIGRAVVSLVFGILGLLILFVPVPQQSMAGIDLFALVFGLVAASTGKDSLHSAQRGLAVAGLTLGVLAGVIGGVGLSNSAEFGSSTGGGGSQYGPVGQ